MRCTSPKQQCHLKANNHQYVRQRVNVQATLEQTIPIIVSLPFKLSSLMEPLINPLQLLTSESHIQKDKNSLGKIATQTSDDPTHLKHNFIPYL